MVCSFIKKETLAQVFSCEFCEISKNTFSYRTPSVAVEKSCLNMLMRAYNFNKKKIKRSFMLIYFIMKLLEILLLLKKAVLKHFVKITGKHFSWGPLLGKLLR